MEYWNDQLFPFLDNLHEHITFMANYTNVRDANVIGQMQNAWNTFVKTGQIWAMIIGIIIGYMFKSLTSYG